MTTEEFSNEFDTLLNSYSSTTDFGGTPNLMELDEYEKSVFLTKAQEEIIIELYNGKNPFRESFESTEELREYLKSLIKTYSTKDRISGYVGISENPAFFKLPEDVWFITYEAVTLKDSALGCKNGTNIYVIPITQDKFHKISRNPFRRPNERKVLRLDVDTRVVELVSKYNIESYTIRYLASPSPIILVDLPNGLKINNVSNKRDCLLSSSIHRAILDRAVRLALASKSIKS